MRTTAAHRLSAVCLVVLAVAVPRGTAAEPAVDRYGDPLPPLARLRIGTARFRHGDEITAITFAPDGKSLATTARDDTVSLWETASGKELLRCRTQRGAGLAFVDGGRSLLWCAADGDVYRVETARRGDATERCELLHRFTDNECVEAASFAPGGGILVAATTSGDISLWPVGAAKGRFLVRQGDLQCLTVVSATLLAMNNGRTGVRLYDFATGKEARAFGDEAVRCLAVSPDGRTLAAGDFDNHIRLWDPAAGKAIRTMEGHRRVPVSGKNGVFCLAFSPDGKALASGGADGTVRLWDVATGKETACCEGRGGRVLALAFSPDGRRLASGDGSVLRLWDAATGREAGPLAGSGGEVAALSVSADGRTLAVVRRPGGLGLWDLVTGQERRPAPLPAAGVSSAAFAPDGATFLTLSAAGRLQSWDAATGAELRPPQDVRPTGRLLAVAPGGKTAAWYADDRRIVLWDVRAGKPLRRLRPEGARVFALCFSTDGRTLVAAGPTGLRLDDVADREGPRDLSPLSGGVRSVAPSPDGRVLAAGGPAGMVRLWEVASGASRRTLFGGVAVVSAVAFSADGRTGEVTSPLLATGGSDGTVRLWDVGSGKRLQAFAGHRGEVVGLAFALQNRSLVTASRDGTALVWDVHALVRQGRAEVLNLSADRVRALWRDLAEADAPQAFEAIQTLALAPAQAVPLVRERVPAVSAAKLAALLRDLDSDTFAVRERARQELAQLGKFAEPSLRKALQEKPSLDVRRRMEELLERLDDPTSVPEHLRALRAVEVLEMIGTPEARRVLRDLAGGAPEALLTQHARAALARLDGRGPSP
jgi:WD40 repeat protein